MSGTRPLRDLSWGVLLERLDADLARAEANTEGDRDEPAWGELYARSLHYAKTFLRKPRPGMRPKADAWESQDLAQQLCTKLHKREVLAKVRAAGQPAGYLVKMLSNFEADHLRQKKEVPRTKTGKALSPTVNSSNTTSSGPKAPKRAEGGPRTLVVRRTKPLSDMVLALQRAVAQLSLKDRALYHERFVLGRSLHDIATDLKISYSAAGVRIHRLKKRLGLTKG